MKKKQKVTIIVLSFLLILITSFGANVIYQKHWGSILEGIEFSASYSDKDGKLLQVFLTSDDKYRVFTPISNYSPEFIEAVLLQEDQYFYQHPGVNFIAVVKAFWETYVKKSRRIGASTITMQTAKLKYNIYTKSPYGKWKQIVMAEYLELCYSKQDILECYLNLVPMGGNVEGFSTGSQFYFNKDIDELNLSQIIMLAVIPQNPTSRAPIEGKTPSELIEARKALFNRWIKNHSEDADKEIYMDMQMDIECKFPNEVRHYTEMLNLTRDPKQQRTVVTTIDLNLQKKVEEIYYNYLKRNANFGVSNGAVLILDYTTMEVVANIGSADYYSDEIQGQVNATTSKRSPGSTLKPFIYAMALEQGLIHYKTMLKDVPQTFNEYCPDNYGSIFKGPVQSWFALADSRNIPAIYLEQNLKKRNLYDFMKKSGVANMEDRDYYGLSIVLGTCDVTMLELAKMYGTLANKGIEHEIRFVKGEKLDRGKRMLTEESAFIVKKMLEANVPPYDNKNPELKDYPIGYKTGTSIGFKDSWSVGIYDKYICVVWIGNFDGQGNNSFLGRKMAAPLLFDIAYSMISQIDKKDRIVYERVPDGVKQVKVCAVSGALPNEDCPQTEMSWFIPGVSPIEKCKIHRRINVDARTGYRTDEEEGPYIKSVVREFWPSDLQNLFEQAGLPRLIPPDYPPDDFMFDSARSGFPPQIISPISGIDYIYRTNNPSRNKIMLNAVGDADVTEFIWFEGSSFITRTKINQSFEWVGSPGYHEITVIDQKGRSDSVLINIVEVEQ